MPHKWSQIALTSIFLPIILILAACSNGTSGSANFEPTLTILSPTETVTATQTETLTPTATETTVPSTTTPEVISQVTPIILAQPTLVTTFPAGSNPANQKSPAAILFIKSPGPESRVASPIMVSAYAYPGQDNQVTMRLYGEDGRVIAEQLFKLPQTDSGWIAFSSQIAFQIHSAGESALLTLITYDGYGRRISLCSVPLILMQIGESEIEVPGFQYQPFYFTKPGSSGSISGGTLHVEGFAHPYNLNPVVIELVEQNGTVLAAKIVPIKATANNEYYTAFSADIPYSVNSATSVRLTVRQMMDHKPFLDLALSSTTILIYP